MSVTTGHMWTNTVQMLRVLVPEGVNDDNDTHATDNPSEVLSHCSHHAAMPFYLITIGYLVKTLISIGIDAWLATRREQIQQREANHSVNLTVNTGIANSGKDYMTMVDSEEDPDNENLVQIRFTRAKLRTRRFLSLGPRWIKCLQLCWTAFKIFKPLYQLVIDSTQVHTYNSGTNHGWHRYQCYAKVFANSPNVGELFVMFGPVAFKYDNVDEATSKEKLLFYGPSFIWLYAYMIAPASTHIVPFAVVYVWVTVLVIYSGPLIVALGKVVIEKLCHRDTRDDTQGKAALAQLLFRSIGLACVLLWALGTSTMIRFYSGDSSYMDSLWLAMSERKTHAFLYHEVRTAMEARNRWYSFIHFFI